MDASRRNAPLSRLAASASFERAANLMAIVRLAADCQRVGQSEKRSLLWPVWKGPFRLDSISLVWALVARRRRDIVIYCSCNFVCAADQNARQLLFRLESARRDSTRLANRAQNACDFRTKLSHLTLTTAPPTINLSARATSRRAKSPSPPPPP